MQILGRRGVEVASVGALGALFTAEAKAAAFTPTLLSAVLNTGTGGGAAVSSRILELAGKAAGAKSIALSSTFTTLTILMKTKATLISAIVLALSAVGTTVYMVSEGDRGTGKESRAADNGNLSSPKARERPAQASKRTEVDPLSRISSGEEFRALVDPGS